MYDTTCNEPRAIFIAQMKKKKKIDFFDVRDQIERP